MPLDPPTPRSKLLLACRTSEVVDGMTPTVRQTSTPRTKRHGFGLLRLFPFVLIMSSTFFLGAIPSQASTFFHGRDCGDRAIKPGVVSLECAGRDRRFFVGSGWSWGDNSAEAEGTIQIDGDRFKATLSLSKPRNCGGFRAFSRAVVRYERGPYALTWAETYRCLGSPSPAGRPAVPRWRLCPTNSYTEELRVKAIRCKPARRLAWRAKERLCRVVLDSSCRNTAGEIGFLPGQVPEIRGRIRVGRWICRATLGYEWRSAKCRKNGRRIDFWNGV